MKNNILEALKFIFVGFLNTLIDYSLFFVLFSLLGLDKNIAQIFSTAIAMTNSYLLNRYFTFKKGGSVRLSEMVRFVFVNLMSLGVTLLCLNLFYDVFALHLVWNRAIEALSLPFFLEGDTAVMACKVLATPFSVLVNFLGNKLWVFREKSEEK